ncbi:hypothetical protein TWF225_008004 [Orbilia oligospora]|nr:hypothetical protein TWF225_008004 [Orbilia oligospora]KAF3236175.1 hypothetical protein TWF128_001466 [Orbilia oligospora]
MIDNSGDIEKKVVRVADVDSKSTSGSGEELSTENATGSTQGRRTVVGNILKVLSYVPRRCRYDPEKEFKFNLALNLLFAFAATFTVANLYYNHPILDILAKDFDVTYERVSIIPNVMQAGYASGLFFITPLGDLFRRRALTLGLILFTTFMWLGCTLTKSFSVFAALSYMVGLTTVTPQLMLPLVGDLAPANRKAASIAIVSSGLQLGLLLARVLSGVITQYSSWRGVYWLGFGVQLLIFSLLWLFMPDYPPKNIGLNYLSMLLSMLKLVFKYPLLVQASVNGGFLAATFMLYWTTLTFLLASPPYEFSSSIIGLFGLIGIAAILVTPWTARYVIDRFHPQLSVILGTGTVLLGQVIGTYAGKTTVAAPVLQAWFIDLGISTAQVANRAGIYQLDASSRNRINSVYMLSVFIGQVMGTGIGAKTYAVGGWLASGSASVGITVLGLLVALGRGPHAKGWLGWDGGSSFKLQTQVQQAGDGGMRAEAGQSGPATAGTPAITSRVPGATRLSASERDRDGGQSGIVEKTALA